MMASNRLVDERAWRTDRVVEDAIDGGSTKMPELMSQVGELTEIIRTNTQLLMKREGRLQDLEVLANALADKADQFQTVTKRALRKIWWRRHKRRVLTVLFITIVTIAIITIVILCAALRVI